MYIIITYISAAKPFQLFRSQRVILVWIMCIQYVQHRNAVIKLWDWVGLLILYKPTQTSRSSDLICCLCCFFFSIAHATVRRAHNIIA